MLMQVKMIGLLITCNLTQHNITEHDLIGNFYTIMVSQFLAVLCNHNYFCVL